jgi:hypothetical protein
MGAQLQNVFARSGISLNGGWNAIPDPHGSGPTGQCRVNCRPN